MEAMIAHPLMKKKMVGSERIWFQTARSAAEGILDNEDADAGRGRMNAENRSNAKGADQRISRIYIRNIRALRLFAKFALKTPGVKSQ